MILNISILLISIQITLIFGTPIHSPIEYIGKFPYHVSIRDNNGKHVCGGAIIKTNIILAPGLCMSNGIADHIVAGSVDPTDTDANFTQSIKIVRAERNIGFFGEKYMILYYLNDALKFGYGVQPIKISRNDPIEMKSARISGFVEINDEKRLRSVEQKISKYDTCKAFINHPIYNDYIVCTIGDSKIDVCRAYEETSLLACYGKEIELCGLPFSNRNFICDNNSTDNNDYNNYNNINNNNNQTEYIAGFAKISAFLDWLSYFGAL